MLHCRTASTRRRCTDLRPRPTANAKQTTLSETDQYRLSAPVVKLGAMLGMKPEMAANVFTIFNILILLAESDMG